MGVPVQYHPFDPEGPMLERWDSMCANWEYDGVWGGAVNQARKFAKV